MSSIPSEVAVETISITCQELKTLVVQGKVNTPEYELAKNLLSHSLLYLERITPVPVTA